VLHKPLDILASMAYKNDRTLTRPNSGMPPVCPNMNSLDHLDETLNDLQIHY
jgi:hypothetical protein